MGLLTIVRGQEVVIYGSRYTFDRERSSQRTEPPDSGREATARETTRELEDETRPEPRQDAGPYAFEIRDPVTNKLRHFVVCWSLSTAGDPPEHLEMSDETKAIVDQEAILLAKREMEPDKWKVFQP